MLLARDPGGQLVEATPAARAECPGCGGRTIAKCGEIVSWHWAHEASADCDRWSEPESEWHLGWKRVALAAGCRVEVTMRHGGQWHRADVVRPDGVVVELQHSPLGYGEAQDREQFYRRHGGLTWLWDVRERYWDNVYHRDGDPPEDHYWQRYSQTVVALRSPMFWDTPEGLRRVSIPWTGEVRALVRVRPATPVDVFSAPVSATLATGTGRWQRHPDPPAVERHCVVCSTPLTGPHLSGTWWCPRVAEHPRDVVVVGSGSVTS